MPALPFTPLTVTSGDDTTAVCGDRCSLREVIAAAGSNDIINLAGVNTVSLTVGELLINKNLTIDGGTGVTITRVSGTFRIFNLTAGIVSMNNLTISNGNVTGGSGGSNNSANLPLTQCQIDNNTASGQGGGINNSATLSVTDCTVSNNKAPQAAGMQNDSSLTMLRCTVRDNTTTGGFGAGLLIFGATTSVTNCTFTRNSTSDNSGAIGIDVGVPATLPDNQRPGADQLTVRGAGTHQLFRISGLTRQHGSREL